MRLIIDSSVLIDHLRGGKTSTLFFQKAEAAQAELFIPTIVVFELFSGQSTKNQQVSVKISKLIEQFKRIDLNEKIAITAGELYRDLNKNIDPEDCIIASSALTVGASVATLNKKHFTQIPNLILFN